MRILESVIYAENLAVARDFYANTLGLEVISYDETRSLFLRLEDSVFIVFKASQTIIPDRQVPAHGATGTCHAAFAAGDAEIENWKRRLTETGVEIIKEIEWQSGDKSIYFCDPAGNVLEFATPSLWDL
ncbi:MAG: VOC family protein [Fimbriimonadaceae bacterium]